ncbi:MAG: hypothetical protein HDQ87_05180 [Clostridia bacterium]|nr:hypothetical protein [Clostridia bacterium]
MTMLIVAAASLAADGLAYLPGLSWLSFLGLTAGAAAWAWGIQMRHAYPPVRRRKLTAVLGIIGTFGGLAAVLIAFTLMTLFYGGLMVF